ncbi:hypothetical protein DV736_g2483, partial [Chaetothyriales sp. CBS 134916]
MNFVTFNQDYSHLAVGTSRGFRIFTTEPFAKVYESRDAGNVALLEMLFSTSLVALVLSPRRLQIKNTKRGSVICELTFPTSILAVRLNRKRLVVVLEDQIYLYDIQTMKLLYTIETSPNPVPICALSPSSDNCYLAYPLPQKSATTAFAQPAHAPPNSTHIAPTTGEVLIFDAVKLEAINVVEAHRSPLSCVAFNSGGTIMATASDKGTIIRVFSVPDAHKLYQFRRGSMPSRIFSLAFNITSTLLCVSSATETNVSSSLATTVGGYLPKGVAEMWEPARDFAWIRLPRSVVAMSPHSPQVMVVTNEGNFYVFAIDLAKGGEASLIKQYSYVETEGRAK